MKPYFPFTSTRNRVGLWLPGGCELCASPGDQASGNPTELSAVGGWASGPAPICWPRAQEGQQTKQPIRIRDRENVSQLGRAFISTSLSNRNILKFSEGLIAEL